MKKVSNKSDATIRTESHAKESKSKRLFEEQISPWIPTAWNTNDYGIDATVQIFSGVMGTSDFKDESKFFLVQLKSTSKKFDSNDNISLQIPVHKIVGWYNSNVPVMLALCYLPTEEFFYKWVDISVVNELDIEKKYWEHQKKVSIRFNNLNKFHTTSRDEVLEYLLTTGSRVKNVIVSPGAYFELRDRSYDFVSTLKEITQGSEFGSINNALQNLEKGIINAIYAIAVTGPSRVGKSTLINKLLRADKNEITPTGLFQTTGVPIQILPGRRNKVIVEFKDGRREEQDFSIDAVETYGSQDKNPDNEKGVNQIHIEVGNKDLEKGVTIFDIPGLDDPNDAITQTSHRIINRSNAIVYVMDISRAATGGFLITKNDKQNLLELGQRLDKIFLVFNKSDVLTQEILILTRERITRDLEKLKLNESIGNRTYYVGHRTTNEMDSIDSLRQSIWSYLLNDNKFGLVRLSVTNRNLLETVANFQQLLNTSLLNNEQMDKLQSALHQMKRKLPELNDKLKFEKDRIARELATHLSLREDRILFDLQGELVAIPTKDPLPSAEDVKNYLTKGVDISIESTYDEFHITMNRISHEVYRWVEENFQEVREIISQNQEDKVIDLDEINQLTMPQADLSSAFGVGFLGAFATAIFNPGSAVFVGILGFLGNLIIGAEGRRQNRITKIMIDARKRYQFTFKRINKAYSDILNSQFQAMELQILENQNYFFEDLKKQMSQLGKKLSQEEKNNYKKISADLKDLVAQIKSHNGSIGRYLDTICN